MPMRRSGPTANRCVAINRCATSLLGAIAPLSILTLPLYPFLTLSALAQTITPAGDRTNTIITRDGERIDISGGMRSGDETNLFHQFEQFNLSREQIVTFLSNPDIRNILAGVQGGEESLIDGLLRVSGGDSNLFLLNPAGIIFGPNARLDVPADFTASTANGVQFGDRWLDLFGSPDYATLVGDPTGFVFSSSMPGTLINASTLSVTENRHLILLGGTVINTGTLEAPGGTITVAAVPGESQVRLTQEGMILSLELPTEDLTDLPSNPLSLPKLLTGGSLPDMGLAIAPDGTVHLTTSTPPIPNTSISTAPGTTIISGTVSTTHPPIHPSTPSPPPQIDILGDRIAILSATLDASAPGNGGIIRIGGDYQGNGVIPNASVTYVSPDASIHADALGTGNGGRILIWADDTTVFHGNLTATGGELRGDGGFAEVSGHESLQFTGNVDLGSVHGSHGTLLLDPENIIISSGADATVAESVLETWDGNTNLTFRADNNIEIRNVSDNQLEIPRGSGNVTFMANADQLGGGNFEIEETAVLIARNETDTNTQVRTVTISGVDVTTGLISTRGGITSRGANVIIQATGNVNTGSITTFADSDLTDDTPTPNPFDAGSITIEGIGEDLPDSINTSRGILSAGASEGSGADIRLEAEGNITTATVSTSSVAGGDRAGNITIISRSGVVDVSRAAQDTANEAFISGLQAANITDQPDAAAGTIILESPIQVITGVISTGTGVNGGTIQITSPRISIGGDISTSEIIGLVDGVHRTIGTANSSSGNIELNGPVNLADDVRITTNTLGGSNAGVLTIAGNINSESNIPYSLAINTGDNRIDVSRSIGRTRPLSRVSIEGSRLNLGGDLVTDNGNITLDAPVTLRNTGAVEMRSGTANILINEPVDAGNTDLTLTADDVEIGNAVTGSGTLRLQPSTADRAIALGTTRDTEALDLSADEISNLSNFNEITLGSPDNTGGITVENAVTFNDPVVLEAGQGLIRIGADINATGTDITLGNTVLVTDATLQSGGGNINFLGTVDGTYDLTANAESGDITFADAVGADQSLVNLSIDTTGILTIEEGMSLEGTLEQTARRLNLGGDVQVGSGDIEIDTPTTLISPASITALSGAITINALVNSPDGANGFQLFADGDITTGAIATNGDRIRLRSNQGNLQAGNLDASSATTGSDIILLSPNGSITSGDLIATGVNGGGDVRVETPVSITTGVINTSTEDGAAGNIILDPEGDIEVVSINTESANGTGGSIDATTEQFFRATGAFTAADGSIASISAIGGTEGGSITIRHFGGLLVTPFNVASLENNGTDGAIVTGTPGALNLITPFASFPGTFEQFGISGNIRILTQDFPAEPNWQSPIEQLDQGDREIGEVAVNTDVFPLEAYFTQQTEDYLGLSDTPILTLDGIRSTLDRIGRQTGIRPALIYAFFYPRTLNYIEDVVFFGVEEVEQTNDILHVLLVTAEGEPVLARVTDGGTREAVTQTFQTLTREVIRSGRASHRDSGSSDRMNEEYLPVSQTLYRWLIQPLEDALEARGIDNLSFIMEPELRSTPLAALHNGNDFIIRRYSVGLMPSLSLTDTIYEDIKTSEVLAGGASDFSGFSDLEPLPGARQEVLSIVQQLWRDALLLNETFTRENLVTAQEQTPHGIVHLATHASFRSGDPGDSYIQLFGEQLPLGEVSEMGWDDVKLLVLSACETARGDEEAELGFGGAAVQTGTESVLASLWKASDLGTLGLMATFYQQLNATEVTIKAEALRRAQLALLDGDVRFENNILLGTDATIAAPLALQDPEHPPLIHPYVWSGFTLIGSPW